MPLAASTCLAVALSIASAEPSTPEPTYATSASSSIPCTVPSSPSGPCSNGSTTVRSPAGASPASTAAAETAGPCGSSLSGSSACPAASASRAPSASAHSPSVEMPIGVTRYFAVSIARRTWVAVTQLTSCSAD